MNIFSQTNNFTIHFNEFSPQRKTRNQIENDVIKRTHRRDINYHKNLVHKCG